MGRARKKTVLTIPPEALPSPWLIDSEFLLNELARVRELVLRVPYHNNSQLALNTVIDSVWRLEEQLRYLLRLRTAGQQSFAQKGAIAEPKPVVAANPEKRAITASA
jgi:hypothetical protein